MCDWLIFIIWGIVFVVGMIATLVVIAHDDHDSTDDWFPYGWGDIDDREDLFFCALGFFVMAPFAVPFALIVFVGWIIWFVLKKIVNYFINNPIKFK